MILKWFPLKNKTKKTVNQETIAFHTTVFYYIFFFSLTLKKQTKKKKRYVMVLRDYNTIYLEIPDGHRYF